MIQENVDLHHHNTMQLPCVARYAAVVDSEQQLQAVLADPMAKQQRLIVLGGGSNVLLAPVLDALVILPQLRGVRLIDEDAEAVVIEAMAGESWHEFVQYTLAQGWYGLENLSLIPGTVGASPIQNIGAYGVEVADRLVGVTALNVSTQQWVTFDAKDCQFGYRDSVFKQQAGRYILTRVRFCLSKKPCCVLGYGDVAARAGDNPSPKQVAEAIVAIRQEKLPDPATIANTGSFFKNPVIEAAHFEQLKARYPKMVGYLQPNGQIKLAAGWLIDQAGWKGRQLGPAGMYAKQALVLVNHGGATLADVQAVSHAVQHDVMQQFGVLLEPEPVCYG